MTIIRAANGLAVDQVPIEQIETSDTVLTHLPDGSPYTFVVDVKRFHVDNTAGTVTIGLQAARETDTHGTGVVATVEAPVGTLTHRIIPHRHNRSRSPTTWPPIPIPTTATRSATPISTAGAPPKFLASITSRTRLSSSTRSMIPA
jgi:hypothetical protein